jgi:hypothetical protein
VCVRRGAAAALMRAQKGKAPKPEKGKRVRFCENKK